MKKFIFSIVMMLMTALTMNAQVATQNSKFFDNTYVGFAAGIETKAADDHTYLGAKRFGSFKAFNPTATIIVGKNITPVFGVRAEGVVRFNAHGANCENGYSYTGKFINAVDVNVLGTFNMNNLIAGYKGEPRTLEFIALYGFGWTHAFYGNHVNGITSKAGLDIAYNFGSKKQWQAFVEPSITYLMQGYNMPMINASPFQYNLNRANLELKAGIIYKFKTSNGTHNFKIYNVGEMQNEIDRLNAALNEKPREVEVIKEVQVEKATGFNVKETIFFAFNSAELDENAKNTLDQLGENGIYAVRGYASSEGSTEYNKALSLKRAEAVAEYLRNRGARVDTVEGLGVVFGPTTGRVAVVTLEPAK